MERVRNFINERVLPEKAEVLFGSAKHFEEEMMMYDCAIREVRTKLEVLNEELSVRYNRNPIKHIKTRLKRPVSILKKMRSKGYEISIESMTEHLNDVAGIRVVCYFIDDIYDIARWLAKQDDIRLLKVKDYIRSPKPNGYRSLHMIIEIPVFFLEEKRMMRVEVQIRTVAMDFWASLEHQLSYKHDNAHADTLGAQLKACADVITQTDQKMLELRKQIEASEDIPTEEEMLFERLARVGL